MSTTPTSIMSFPSATLGPDSASFRVQKGVRYIGRIEADGAAVWEAICEWMGVDSQRPDMNRLSDLFRQFFDSYMAALPSKVPGNVGVPFRDGNFLMVSTEGSAQPDPELPWFFRALFTGAITEYFSNLPNAAPTSGVSRDGSFVLVPEKQGNG